MNIFFFIFPVEEVGEKEETKEEETNVEGQHKRTGRNWSLIIIINYNKIPIFLLKVKKIIKNYIYIYLLCKYSKCDRDLGTVSKSLITLKGSLLFSVYACIFCNVVHFQCDYLGCRNQSEYFKNAPHCGICMQKLKWPRGFVK